MHASPSHPSPRISTASPATQAELIDVMRQAFARNGAIYPIGGKTSCGDELPIRTPGIRLATAGLNRIIDFPARDMTITVEAGITLAVLAETLARERMRLPVDVPQADRATLGGVIATNMSGPRRYGEGTMRDYVIGITAVDGRGSQFKGGGRVVKNVAGYDFCKLLTGSQGTLGVITQVTLKVKPIPAAFALLRCDVDVMGQAGRILEGLVHSRATPVAIELLAGKGWPRTDADEFRLHGAGQLVLALEGTRAEVDWMAKTLIDELGKQEVAPAVVDPAEAPALWAQLVEFPAATAGAVTLKANLRPSAVIGFIRLLLEMDPSCSIQAHAGNGIVLARLSLDPAACAALIRERLQPAVWKISGDVVVLSGYNERFDRGLIWGRETGAAPMMKAIKAQFDPKGLLNPGRFVY